jgi:hypothetical protein
MSVTIKKGRKHNKIICNIMNERFGEIGLSIFNREA